MNKEILKNIKKAMSLLDEVGTALTESTWPNEEVEPLSDKMNDSRHYLFLAKTDSENAITEVKKSDDQRKQLISILYESINAICDVYGLTLTVFMSENLSRKSFDIWNNMDKE